MGRAAATTMTTPRARGERAAATTTTTPRARGARAAATTTTTNFYISILGFVSTYGSYLHKCYSKVKIQNKSFVLHINLQGIQIPTGDMDLILYGTHVHSS